MPNDANSDETADYNQIAARLSELGDRAKQTSAEIAELVRQAESLRARGTRDNIKLAPEKPRGPHWVGDNGPTPELTGAIAAICSERPLTHAEIVEATGARPGRVSGCLVEMRRAKMPLVNIGSGNRARYWFVTPDAAERATARTGREGL